MIIHQYESIDIWLSIDLVFKTTILTIDDDIKG